ncbi:hypothetical protein Bhyg_05509 [Pseudolycoriella hygida]|uniref:Uncharacterized protein n=1 Tax=Pseudolycoriella hygida TaxID=35572 RepID=A0A9Q0MYV3_9DIPT|nr:hypothetical protein Bhyg_05509 [Pseudolycoriella hygida]
MKQLERQGFETRSRDFNPLNVATQGFNLLHGGYFEIN